mgnify:CR=1 FL=1
MSAPRYLLTISLPGTDLRWSHKTRTRVGDTKGFLREVEYMLESGEMKRFVDGFVKAHGGLEKIESEWQDYYLKLLEAEE